MKISEGEEHMEAEKMIEIENLTKIYNLYEKPIDRLKESLSIGHKCYHKEHYALKDVSFTVNRGESIGIMGINGSGKSTILKIITGVLNPTSGKVVTHGKISALLELGAGFNPEYTGIENIYLNGTMMGYTKEEMKERVPSIVEFADIGDFINQPVKTYSSGMFARLAFAVSINVEPEILIVDEALSVGDIRFQLKCIEKMKQMMKGGTTVLFVSHDVNAIRRFCTRAIWLRHGVIEEDGDVNRISDKYLDFLKIGEEYYDEKKNEDTAVKTEEDKEQEEEKLAKNVIAEITSFKVMNSNNVEVSEVDINEPLNIEVTYNVYDENIKKPVVGIAVRGMDDDYVCGLNSLLDNHRVDWKKGENRITLRYTQGMLAIGGKYYFDVALYDETATVPIQYISVVKKIAVYSGYKGEGRYIIPHVWENGGNNEQI